jgi:hypothetical protein
VGLHAKGSRDAAYLPAAFLRSAQYFFILTLTAFFIAADIGGLGRRAGSPLAAPSAGAAADRPRLRRKSGNAPKILSSSAVSSATRASAPRRAYCLTSNFANIASVVGRIVMIGPSSQEYQK